MSVVGYSNSIQGLHDHSRDSEQLDTIIMSMFYVPGVNHAILAN